MSGDGEGAWVPLADLAALLVPDEPLPCRIVDPTGRLLLGAGQRLLGPAQLQALIERDACVAADEADALRRARGVGGEVPASAPVATWFDAWEQQTWALDALLRRIAREPAPALGDALWQLVDRQLALVDAFPDGAIFLAVRQDDRRFALYALTHGMHAATVVVLAARVLGWTPARVRALAGAALSMNLAIVELQSQMAEQAEPPTKAQLAQLRAHPARAVAQLQAAGIADADWLTAVGQHHERADGSGYPQGLSSVHEVAHLLRAADVFTAKISPRALRPAMVPQAAARELFQAEGGGPVAAAVIKAIGVYPPGDWVQLRNGEAGVVLQRPQPGRATTVVALRGADGRPLADPPRRDTGQEAFTIAGPVSDRSALPRVPPEQVYGLVPA